MSLDSLKFEYDTLDKLHMLIFCGAVSVLRSHNEQIGKPNTDITMKVLQKPIW